MVTAYVRCVCMFACYCPFQIGLHSQYFKHLNRERPMQFECCTLTIHNNQLALANNHWLGLLSFKWDCLFVCLLTNCCTMILFIVYFYLHWPHTAKNFVFINSSIEMISTHGQKICFELIKPLQFQTKALGSEIYMWWDMRQKRQAETEREKV